MSAVNLVAVFVENKPGQTARVTKLLADVGVSLCWLTIANSGSFGVMKFLVDQRDLAVQTLKEKGLMVSLLEVLAVMPVQRGNASSFGATRGRGSISNTTCFRRTVKDVCPDNAAASSASHPVRFHAAKLCR